VALFCGETGADYELSVKSETSHSAVHCRMEHEHRLRAEILSARDKPEAAVKYAEWLLSHRRAADALIIVEAALSEGPRFDLYELRAFSTLTSLEQLWRKGHVALGVTPRDSAEVYNAGLGTSTKMDWKSVFARIA
jgi:hypothetical protein